MGIPLEEALQAVDLEAGRTYRCVVKDHQIELRVLKSEEKNGHADKKMSEGEIPQAKSEIPALGPTAALVTESDLAPDEAWIDFPLPRPICRVRAKLGTLPLPDPIDFPVDDDDS